jgi:hypothetical protein
MRDKLSAFEADFGASAVIYELADVIESIGEGFGDGHKYIQTANRLRIIAFDCDK